jgi:RimJ/RimL family protein N-acetyltransferase
MKGEVFLSLFNENDLNRLFEIQSDADLAKARQAKMVAKNQSQVSQWLASKSELQSPSNFCLGVRDKISLELIGYVSLKRFNEQDNVGEVGIVLQSSLRKGAGSLAIKLLELLSSESFGYEYFVAKVSLENTIAISFFKKNDYVQIDLTDSNVIFQKSLDS